MVVYKSYIYYVSDFQNYFMDRSISLQFFPENICEYKYLKYFILSTISTIFHLIIL